MDSRKNVIPERTRKPYQKPIIERVRLVPEEAVLSVCKLPSTGADFGATFGCSNPDACHTSVS